MTMTSTRESFWARSNSRIASRRVAFHIHRHRRPSDVGRRTSARLPALLWPGPSIRICTVVPSSRPLRDSAVPRPATAGRRPSVGASARRTRTDDPIPSPPLGPANSRRRPMGSGLLATPSASQTSQTSHTSHTSPTSPTSPTSLGRTNTVGGQRVWGPFFSLPGTFKFT